MSSTARHGSDVNDGTETKERERIVETMPPSDGSVGTTGDGSNRGPLDARWRAFRAYAPQLERLAQGLARDASFDAGAFVREGFRRIDDARAITIFRLAPKHSDDYPRRLDLLAASSYAFSRMWQASDDTSDFSSNRYSNDAEVLCYLKVDGVEGSAYSDRLKLESGLAESLVPQKLGSVVGGGTGIRYAYVDLALKLQTIDESVSAIRDLAKSARLPKRSWILFFDAAWQHEWIGLFEDTPAPP
jgi:hypothetical protein